MRSLSAAVTALVLVGCATTSTTSNAQYVRSLYDAFARGDMPAVLAGLAPDVVWMEAEGTPYADRNPYRGPQAVATGVFQRLGADWNNFRADVERVVDGGDTVVVLGRYRATNRQTGRALDAPFAHVWNLRDGKVVRFDQYVDTAQVARASTP